MARLVMMWSALLAFGFERSNAEPGAFAPGVSAPPTSAPIEAHLRGLTPPARRDTLADVDLGPHAANPVFADLIGTGVSVRDDFLRPLPAPSMADRLDAESQRAVMEQISDRNHPVEALVRRSIVAPFVLKIEAERRSKGAVLARRIDLWCIAYGELDLVSNETFLRELAGAMEEQEKDRLPSSSHFLEPPELAKRELSVTKSREFDEAYVHVTFPLLERVHISATRRMIATRTDESVVLAARLDERFTRDAEFPNRWRPIRRDRVGKPLLGDAQPYAGAGFYLKITRLIEPEDALFVEYHQVFDEPQAWFGGTGLLRSKLPLVVQNTVRKFRRKLASASSGDAGPPR